MARVYDTFLLFNELELLELRLNELQPVVDRFVLVEATRTFSNKPKSLHFDANASAFQPFKDKIIHVVVDDLPQTTDTWTIEHFQRDCISRGLTSCQPDDIIMVSDVDEIPQASKVREGALALRFNTTVASVLWHRLLRQRFVFRTFRNLFKKWHPFVTLFEQRQFSYYLNCVSVDTPRWYGTRMTHFRDFTTASDLRRWKGRLVANGGWHFTFMGGVERVRDKIAAYSHQEFNTAEITDPDHVAKALRDGRNVTDEKSRFDYVRIDESYPAFLRQNLSRYSSWIRETN